MVGCKLIPSAALRSCNCHAHTLSCVLIRLILSSILISSQAEGRLHEFEARALALAEQNAILAAENETLRAQLDVAGGSGGEGVAGSELAPEQPGAGRRGSDSGGGSGKVIAGTVSSDGAGALGVEGSDEGGPAGGARRRARRGDASGGRPGSD